MRVLVLSGGRHPYGESTPVLESFLRAAGHEVTVTEDASVLSDSTALAGYDVLVFNTRRENLPDAGDLALSQDERRGLAGFIRGGKGFVCLHIATCRPGPWPGYHQITGGGWITGTSFHPPYGQFTVNVKDPSHQGVRGVSDFTTNDELYMGIAFNCGNQVFITADAEEGTHPWGPHRQPKHMPGGDLSFGMDS